MKKGILKSFYYSKVIPVIFFYLEEIDLNTH